MTPWKSFGVRNVKLGFSWPSVCFFCAVKHGGGMQMGETQLTYSIRKAAACKTVWEDNSLTVLLESRSMQGDTLRQQRE